MKYNNHTATLARNTSSAAAAEEIEEEGDKEGINLAYLGTPCSSAFLHD